MSAINFYRSKKMSFGVLLRFLLFWLLMLLALLDFLAASEISYYLVWYSLLISQVCCPDATAPAPAKGSLHNFQRRQVQHIFHWLIPPSHPPSTFPYPSLPVLELEWVLPCTQRPGPKSYLKGLKFELAGSLMWKAELWGGLHQA